MRVELRVVISLGLGLFVAACGSGRPSAVSEDGGSAQIIDEFILVETDSSLRLWRLDALTGRYMEEDSIFILSGVEMTFFEDDIPSTFLEGDSGRVEIEKGRMRVWGNVRVETNDGRILEAPELLWNEGKDYFRSDCLVTLTIPDSLGQTVMSGRGVKLTTGLGATEGVDIRESFEAIYTGELEETEVVP